MRALPDDGKSLVPGVHGPPHHRTLVTPRAQRGTRPGSHGTRAGNAIASATSTHAGTRSAACEGMPSRSPVKAASSPGGRRARNGRRLAICARVSRSPIRKGWRYPGAEAGEVEVGAEGLSPLAAEVGPETWGGGGNASSYTSFAAMGWCIHQNKCLFGRSDQSNEAQGHVI